MKLEVRLKQMLERRPLHLQLNIFRENRRKEYKWQIVITVSSIRIAVVWEKCLDFVEVIHQQR